MKNKIIKNLIIIKNLLKQLIYQILLILLFPLIIERMNIIIHLNQKIKQVKQVIQYQIMINGEEIQIKKIHL